VLVAGAADAVVICPRAWLRDGSALSDGAWEIDPLALLGSASTGVPCVVPGSTRGALVAAGTGSDLRLVLNGARVEIAREVLEVLDGASPTPSRPGTIDAPGRAIRFADSVLDRLGNR
jgi:hypothetical protein